MNKELINNKIQELLKTNACNELKDICKKYLEVLNTEEENIVRKELINELEEDIIPIDGLIAFCGSEEAKKVFGEEKAKAFHDHGVEIKAKGAKYCDCPACNAALSLLNELK